MSERSKKITAVVAAILIVATAIGATVCMVKHKKTESVETTTESTTVTTTAKAAYMVDLEYIERMLNEKRFTDQYEKLAADTYITSSNASKKAYWKGIESSDTGVINPLLLAATATDLNLLGFREIPAVTPSELYSEETAMLTAKGEETLKAVKNLFFSEQVSAVTTDLRNNNSSGEYYNSSSSKQGIVYSQNPGITGNTVCWLIAISDEPVAVDGESVDEQFSAIFNDSKEQKSDKKTVEEPKEILQLTRCGNTVTKKPPKPTEPTTKPTEPTTKPTEPTTKPTEPTTKPTEPTTKPTQPTTKPTQPTTQPTTKNQQKDPVNQGNADRGGGSKRSEEDKTATTRYQAEEPTMPSSVRKVTTTKAPTTTEPTTTKVPSTTKAPTTTKPTTTAPKAEPTHVESNTYVDKDTGKTTVVNDEVVVTGAITRPKR